MTAPFKSTRVGSFGARACRTIRKRLLTHGVEALPKSWRRPWIVQRILATPPWADMREIRAVYLQAAFMTHVTGKRHEVDHIIPLNHPRVCGLHIAANLQAISADRNANKSNYWCPEQIEMFDEPEQLRLL